MQAFVFIDTNVLLHYRSFDEVDWPGQLGATAVTLVFAPVVLTELDRHKWSGSRREKARAKSTLKKLSASFVVTLAEKSIAPFLLPAHRTVRADFPHTALGRVSRQGMRTGRTDEPFGSCLAFTSSARWSVRIFSGVTRLTPIPLSSARPSAPRTRAPSLHRRYPVSAVLMSPSDACRAHHPGKQVDLHVSVDSVDLNGLRLLRGDSALAFTLSGPAQASLALRPAHLLTRPKRTSVPGASTARSPSPSPG